LPRKLDTSTPSVVRQAPLVPHFQSSNHIGVFALPLTPPFGLPQGERVIERASPQAICSAPLFADLINQSERRFNGYCARDDLVCEQRTRNPLPLRERVPKPRSGEAGEGYQSLSLRNRCLDYAISGFALRQKKADDGLEHLRRQIVSATVS